MTTDKQKIEFQTLQGFDENSFVSCFVDYGLTPIEERECDLSINEREESLSFSNFFERRHFITRRWFQRHYLKLRTGFTGEIQNLELIHRRDKAPIYALQPNLNLSFTSSANHYVAASSTVSKIGIDIEAKRAVPNPIEIAYRFFHSSERNYLEKLGLEQAQTEFLKFWTIKEACLKAIGRGVVFGLDTFLIRLHENQYVVEPPPAFGSSKDWRIKIMSHGSGNWVTVAQFNSHLGW